MTIEIRVIATFLAAFFAAMFVLPQLFHVANKVGLVDVPDERKVHKVPRPLVGGIGIVIAATFSSLLFASCCGMAGYFTGLVLLLLVGILDDLHDLGHKKKFIAQIAATSLLIYFSQVQLSNFGNLLGLGNIVIPDFGWLLWAVTVFSVVGVTNAVNMLDGLDGLAGSVSFTCFLTFAVLSSLQGSHGLVLVNLAVAGAILGFLRYNWSPAILFMGDAGSLCLGFSLSFMALMLTQGETSLVHPVIVLLVLAVPIADTLVVMTRRVLDGKSPFKPDNTHLHHILLHHGFTGKKPVKIMLALCITFCATAVLGTIFHVPEHYLFAGFMVYVVFNWFASFFAQKLMQVMTSFAGNGKAVFTSNIFISFIDREK